MRASQAPLPADAAPAMRRRSDAGALSEAGDATSGIRDQHHDTQQNIHTHDNRSQVRGGDAAVQRADASEGGEEDDTSEEPIARDSLVPVQKRPKQRNDSSLLSNQNHQPQAQTQAHNVASAALVARGALKSGYLWKMGCNVPRWKRRYFVLKPITMLFYYMSEHDTEPRGCIDLDLFDAVRRVGGRQDHVEITASQVGGSSAIVGGSNRGRANRTAFELYRSGYPEGSGFMLEARGHEDWEHWVETIANGRHGKVQAEADVLKGTNKLLLEEIRGLERQVTTFRGYADQRHVTVLALRDERQRNRELVTELASLGDVASILSAHIKGGASSASNASNNGTTADDNHPNMFGARIVTTPMSASALVGAEGQQRNESEISTSSNNRSESCATSTIDTITRYDGPLTVSATCPRSSSPNSSPSSASKLRAKTMAEKRQEEVQRNETVGATPAVTDVSNAVGVSGGNVVGGTNSAIDNIGVAALEEKVALEAMRVALGEARTELDRRASKARKEEDRRIAVEASVKAMEDRVKAAEKSAREAESGAARARGRVSVLERNVEYLQRQHQGLRAELCQAHKRTQLVRAQKAVLKKEVRDMWARQHATPTLSSTSGGGPRSSRTRVGTDPRPISRSRTWCSMGELIEADGDVDGAPLDASARIPSRSRCATTGPSVRTESGDCGRVGGLGDSVERGAVEAAGMRSCLSGVSLGASDGGDTDLAEHTSSEASDEDCPGSESGGCRPPRSRAGYLSSRQHRQKHHETNPLMEGIRRTIRLRVGEPEIPPLPTPRQQQILKAAKRLSSSSSSSSCSGGGGRMASPNVSSGVVGGIPSSGGARATGGAGEAGGGIVSVISPQAVGAAAVASPGLGVAGMLLSGLTKGSMVEKAAQEMGKHLALWPGGLSSSGSAGGGGVGGESGRIGIGSLAQVSSLQDLSSSMASSGSSSPRMSLSRGVGERTGGRMAVSRSSVSLNEVSSSTSSTAQQRWGSGGTSAAASIGARRASVHDLNGGSAAAGGAGLGAGTTKCVPGSSAGVDGDSARAAQRQQQQQNERDLSVTGARLPHVVSRTALIQLSDLELAEPCEDGSSRCTSIAAARKGSSDGEEEQGEDTKTATIVRDDLEGEASSAAGAGAGVTGGWRSSKRLSTSSTSSMSMSTSISSSCLLPPRPDDDYELVFTSRVIGLQFTASANNQSVLVQGHDGYAGPTGGGLSSGALSGGKTRPAVGDILDSYNGISAQGKSWDVVRRELAACGRPLRLGFRLPAPRVGVAEFAGIESSSGHGGQQDPTEQQGEEGEEEEWSFGSQDFDGVTDKSEGGIGVGGGLGSTGVSGSSYGVTRGVIDSSMRMRTGGTGSGGTWRAAGVTLAPAWAR